MNIYLASPISQTYEKDYVESVAVKIENTGYNVYAAHRNKTINDKTLNPSSKDIFLHDMNAIYDSDILVVNLNGSRQEGTIFELGALAGINYERVLNGKAPIIQITFTTNTRLMNPQVEETLSRFFSNKATLNVPSSCSNHLVLGSSLINGDIVVSEENMILLLNHFKSTPNAFEDYHKYISEDIINSYKGYCR